MTLLPYHSAAIAFLTLPVMPAAADACHLFCWLVCAWCVDRGLFLLCPCTGGERGTDAIQQAPGTKAAQQSRLASQMTAASVAWLPAGELRRQVGLPAAAAPGWGLTAC